MESFSKLEGFNKVSRPQFNISLFNRNVILTANQKLVNDAITFLAQGADSKNDFDDLIESFELLSEGKQEFYKAETGEFSCSKFDSMFIITMEPDFCLALSDYILEFAGTVCAKNPNLDLNALVAFGKKLETAGQGNYLSLNKGRTKPGVREIIIRKEYVR